MSDKQTTNSDYNPKLDFFCEEFDPLLALNSPDIVIPVPNAKLHDNIHKFMSTYQSKTGENKPKKAPEPKPIERRWQPHQLPIKKVWKTGNNLFKRMETTVGPLQALNKCVNTHQKVKVFTRHSYNIRGYCIGYVVAFDKHWNLAMTDVDEVWDRLKHRKIPAYDNVQSDLWIKSKVQPPQVTITKSTKKTETCSRHVNQLLMRGEHIAYIVLISENLKE